jgi:hypothetical protein
MYLLHCKLVCMDVCYMLYVSSLIFYYYYWVNTVYHRVNIFILLHVARIGTFVKQFNTIYVRMYCCIWVLMLVVSEADHTSYMFDH